MIAAQRAEALKADCGPLNQRISVGRLFAHDGIDGVLAWVSIRDEVPVTHPVVPAASVVLDMMERRTVAGDGLDDRLSGHSVHRKVFRFCNRIIRASER